MNLSEEPPSQDGRYREAMPSGPYRQAPDGEAPQRPSYVGPVGLLVVIVALYFVGMGTMNPAIGYIIMGQTAPPLNRAIARLQGKPQMLERRARSFGIRGSSALKRGRRARQSGSWFDEQVAIEAPKSQHRKARGLRWRARREVVQ